MIRSLILVTAFALVAPLFAVAADVSAEDEARLLKVAEQRVLEELRARPQLGVMPNRLPRLAGAAVIDADHVQVDAYFVTESSEMIAGSNERLLYTVSQDEVSSLGAPNGEVAVIGTRNPMFKARADALERFAKMFPEDPMMADGTQPMIKDVATDLATGQITIVCESFGGIAAIWMGNAYRFTYSRDGKFVAQNKI
jgi:protein-disulfide isomerase